MAEFVDGYLGLDFVGGECLGDCYCGGETAHSAADDDDLLDWGCHCGGMWYEVKGAGDRSTGAGACVKGTRNFHSNVSMGASIYGGELRVLAGALLLCESRSGEYEHERRMGAISYSLKSELACGL